MSERIALLIESDGPGGAESVVLALAEEYRNAGHTVFPVVHGGGPRWLTDRLLKAGFPVHSPVLRRSVDPAAVRDLARWMHANRVTAAHAHEFTTSVYGGAAARIRSVPSIITMHGGKAYTYALRRRVALSLAARSAHAVVGVSRDTANLLADSLWLHRDRIDVVPNGVNVKPGDRARGRRSLKLMVDDRLLLAVGNLYRVKGHDVLVHAAALMSQDTTLPPWHIAIAGRGDQEAALRELIERLGVQRRVSLIGLRDDVPDLLAAADLFVMPSRSEGLPMAILEAMFAGTPVVCSRVGGIPELLDHGALGALCTADDPADLARHLAAALLDEDTTYARAKTAQARARTRYSARAMAATYLSLLARA